MESKATENESEKVERDKEESLNGEQGQDSANETKNEMAEQDLKVAVEESQLSDQRIVQHHDSPSHMLVKEDTPYPSHSNNLLSETNIKKDDPLATKTETTDDDKNIKLESNPHQGPLPSVSVDRDKVSTNTYEESLVEHNNGSVKLDKESSRGLEIDPTQPGTGVSKDDQASVKGIIYVSMDHEKGSIIADKPSIEDGKDKVKDNSETSTDHDKGSVALNTEPMKLDTGLGEPDTKNFTRQDREPLKLDDKTITEQDNGLVKPETVTDLDKGLVKLDTETSAVQDNGHDKPDTKTLTDLDKESDMHGTETSTENDKETSQPGAEPVTDVKVEVPDSVVQSHGCNNSSIFKDIAVASESVADAEKKDTSEATQRKAGDIENESIKEDSEPGTPHVASSEIMYEEGKGGDSNNGVHNVNMAPQTSDGILNSKHSFLLYDMSEGSESGTEEDQSAFMKELENFFKERQMEFKPPKFYGEGLNCLKLWRAVIRLGGYDKVTTCKLWRQVGEAFRPPKTCTTVSWTFRGFYEKALLDYERHKASGGELNIPIASHSEPMNIDNQASGSGRARRDAAARAMQGWHSQRLLGNGEVGDPIIKDKNSVPPQKREKQLGSLGLLKRKKPPYMEQGVKAVRTKVSKPQVDVAVIDVGAPADWVKINVQRTKDCFEVYALVPGLLREEVRVQSDPAGHLVISGEPEHPDNPWGVTPFKKVVNLPSRIDPHQTSAVVTLNGQLFVRVPFEQSD